MVPAPPTPAAEMIEPAPGDESVAGDLPADDLRATSAMMSLNPIGVVPATPGHRRMPTRGRSQRELPLARALAAQSTTNVASDGGALRLHSPAEFAGAPQIAPATVSPLGSEGTTVIQRMPSDEEEVPHDRERQRSSGVEHTKGGAAAKSADDLLREIAAAPVADQPSSPPTGDGTRSAAASNTVPASRRTARDGLPLVGPQVQRTSAAGSATAARPAPVKQITAAPVIQRATLQSPIPTATTVEVIQRAEGAVENAPTTSNRQALLNDLARQIYPLVKRMLAIERERRVFR